MVDLSRTVETGERAGGRRLLSFWRVVVVFAVMGVVGLLLGAQSLHLHADRLSRSPFRTVALAITGPLATASDFLYLDRPWEWAAGRSDTPASGAVSAASGSLEPSGAGLPGIVSTPRATTTTTTLRSSTATPSGTTTPPVTSSTTTTTEPEPVFTREDPLRILVVGDSLSVMMGYGLMRQAEVNPALEVQMVTKVSSGLSRPDFYDWPRVLAEIVAGYRPHVTVILFGGNDKQPLRTQGASLPSFSTEWVAEYYLRIWAFLDIIIDAGGEAVWMGLPIMRSDQFSETCRTLNAMYSAVCEHRREATYVDGYSLFEDDEGNYNAYLVDASGKRQLMRARDGIHLSNAGGDRQAEAVMEVLRESYRLEP